MRKSKTIKLADREFTIKELMVKDIYFLLEDAKKLKEEIKERDGKIVENAGSLVADVIEKNEANIQKLWRTCIPDLRKEDFLEFGGHEINDLITEIKKMNEGFFLAAKQLGIPQAIGWIKNILAAMNMMDILQVGRAIWTISLQALISSAPGGTPESSNTDTASS